jgi:hypothetical protein
MEMTPWYLIFFLTYFVEGVLCILVLVLELCRLGVLCVELFRELGIAQVQKVDLVVKPRVHLHKNMPSRQCTIYLVPTYRYVGLV